MNRKFRSFSLIAGMNLSPFGLVLLGCCLLCSWTQAQSVTRFNRADSLRGYLNPYRSAYDVTFYDLHVRVRPADQFISGHNTIHFRTVEPFSQLQLDLFANMDIAEITCEGQPLAFRREGDAVFVQLPERQVPGSTNAICVVYSGQPVTAVNPPWEGGFVWREDARFRPWIGVACEGMGASLWWPNKDHLSEKPDSMAITCEVPAALMAVANGTLRQVTVIDSGDYRRFEWFVHYPINNYNVTINVGDYVHLRDTYQSPTGRHLDLDYYVLRDNREKAQQHFEQVKPMLRHFEALFGPYPFWNDGYALVETPYWGMEHQSAIAYGSDYRNNEFGFDFIILHESGHEYWGNSVSVRDHGEMWIHEGFCTYAEALFLEARDGYDTAVRYLRTQRKQIKNQEPMLGPLDVNYRYWEDADIYHKGTWLLHTLRNWYGDSARWHAAIRALATDYAHRFISTPDVVAHFEKHTGLPLRPFFDQYLKHPLPPRLAYRLERKGNETILHYRWETEVSDFAMPYRVRVPGGSWRDLQPTDAWQTLALGNVGKVRRLEGDDDSFYVLLKPTK